MTQLPVCYPSLVARPDVVIVSHARSGTHLLADLLESHPAIVSRGECILRYRRALEQSPDALEAHRKYFLNQEGMTNLAIVMYDEIDLYEALVGPLSEVKVIHLLRNPADVANSVMQMLADKERLGAGYKAHYKRGETAHAPAPVARDPVAFDGYVTCVRDRQRQHCDALLGHPDVLTVRYEEITNRGEITTAPLAVCERLLKFIGVEQHALSTELKKSAR